MIQPDDSRDLQTHRDVLALIDNELESSSNGLTSQAKNRLENATRLLVDAYIDGDDARRQVIRQMLNSLGSVRLFMHIPASEIKNKIDGVRFRLALFIESMKDLGPDPEQALGRLDLLCAAGTKAGIDINAVLREVAFKSNSIDQYGIGSMRRHLLSRIVDKKGAICEACKKSYPLELPACPHCGTANPEIVRLYADSSGEAGESEPASTPTRTYFYLPTPELLKFLLAHCCAVGFVILLVAQVVLAWRTESFLQTTGAWVRFGFMALLAGIAYFLRYFDIMRRYRGRGYLGVTWRQGLLIFGIIFSAALVLVVFLANFGRALGL